IYTKPPSFYRDGIRKLPEKWQKVINYHGNYFDDRSVFILFNPFITIGTYQKFARTILLEPYGALPP
ncbi:hypothetical protein WH47_05401, partial [Habropoda laboriosa]